MSGSDRRAQLVVLGLGGQGIIFLTRVVAEAATDDGRDVLTAETRGMAQRGGAVESHLKLGSFGASLVRRGRADAVLVLDPRRIATARAFLRPEGTCFVNGGGPSGAQACDAAAIAREIGYARGANLVLLGFATATAPDLFPQRASILRSLERLSPPAAWEDNRRAFEGGVSAAAGKRGAA